MDNRYNSNQSFWENELYHQEYDLVIIGAGLTGLSTAYFSKKKKPDLRILILERGVFPIGASTRNAGFACIGSIGEYLADLELDSEHQLQKRIKARFEGLELLKSTLGPQAIDFDECGGWEIFTDPKAFDRVRNHIPRINEWMKSLLGESEVYKEGVYEGNYAIFNRLEGALHPGKMMKKLIELNHAIGNEVRWKSEVKKIDVAGGLIQTESGIQITASSIVLATNAFTPKLTLNNDIQPGRGYVFITKPITNFKWKSTFHYNKGYVYFRNLGSDRLLIGGGRNIAQEAENTSEFGFNSQIKEYLIHFVDSVIKLPKGWEIESEWSGIMGFTDSKSPSIKQVGKRTWQVAGLSGMGVALGMSLGKKVSEKLII